ncbi:MAG: replication-relaxation family protein [Candidatus Binatia bacterium]
MAKIKITENDLPLFRLVDGHRLIDSRQLELALLGDGNPRHFRDRLERLSDQEYLHRPPAQKQPRHRRHHMIYALGIRGRELLDEIDQVQRVGKRDWRNENKRLKPQTLDHEIAVTETVLALHIAAQHRGWGFEWWHDPRYHTARVLPEKVAIDPVHGRFTSLPLHPDSYAIITLEHGHRVNLFIEVDRGTEPHDRASLQKMLAYWDYITAAVKAHGSREQSWRVLIATTTEERLQNMRREAQERVDPKKKGTHVFLLTTLDRCRIDLEQPLRVFDDHLWWSTKIGYDNPRKLFLDACPKCHQLIDTANEPHEILNADPRVALAPATSPLPDLLPDDAPLYAHTTCPGHR